MVKYIQTIRRYQSKNLLSVFDHFVVLALKRVKRIEKAHQKWKKMSLNCDLIFLLEKALYMIIHKNRQYLGLYDYSILYYSVLLKNI